MDRSCQEGRQDACWPMVSQSMHGCTYLFVPGDRPDRFDKAAAAGSDHVIFDLEDAVGPEHKDAARENVVRWFLQHEGTNALVRINASDTVWFAADAAACRQIRVKGVILPKAENVGQIDHTARQLPSDAAVFPLIETGRGLANAMALGAATKVQRLLFGSVDFSLDLGIEGEMALHPYRAQLVLASRLAGLPAPIDGPCTALRDESAVREHAQRAKSQGFGGVLCIHPTQVASVLQAYASTPADLAWARSVVAAANVAGGSAVQVNGRMIDRPILLRAQTILRSVGLA